MPDDLGLIKQLERQIGRELMGPSFEEIMRLENIVFYINEKVQVTGLNLDRIILISPILTTLSKLHHLGCILVQCQKTPGR